MKDLLTVMVVSRTGRPSSIEIKNDRQSVIDFAARIATGEIPAVIERIFTVNLFGDVVFYELVLEDFRFKLKEVEK
jgi:hypothetical protein